MKIALLAPFEEQVPPKKYGGTELVVANLADSLVDDGHEVTLFATGDSKTKAKLVSIFPRALRVQPEMQDGKLREAYKYIGIGRVIEYMQQHEFDIIHNHIGWRVLAFSHLIPAPMVTTLHGPLDIPYHQHLFSKEHAKQAFISISLSQRRPLPTLNYVANVYNGIDTSKFTYRSKPDNYFAFLGRMSPEKGPVQAIQMAKKAGVKLVMAAKVDAVDKEYFTQEVEPLIDGKQIQFIGEVNHRGKVKLLSHAKALLAPIQWEEPFGLYFVEAMACGTPVIAIGRGSVPELIKDEVTGRVITNNLDEGVAAIQSINTINRAICRAIAVERFDKSRMAQDYAATYRKVITKTPNQGKTYEIHFYGNPLPKATNKISLFESKKSAQD